MIFNRNGPNQFLSIKKKPKQELVNKNYYYKRKRENSKLGPFLRSEGLSPHHRYTPAYY